MTDEQLDISDEIAASIGEAHVSSGRSVNERLEYLEKAQELLLHPSASRSLLDNFSDEMFEFSSDSEPRILCFVASFIENSIKKDNEMIRKAVMNLTYLIDFGKRESVLVTKKVIAVCTQIYPIILCWAAQSHSTESEKCWAAFSELKGRLMPCIDSDNEGVRTRMFKFLEAIILAQSLKTQESESGRGDVMCLNEVKREHRFVSYRKLEIEATRNFGLLVEHLSSAHISSLNLLTCLACIQNIVQQRPHFMQQAINAFESLNLNLPPTLSTSQVKSVRKELKMHLSRIYKHQSSVPHQKKLTTLLLELGASHSEISRMVPSSASRKKQRVVQPSDEVEKKRAKLDEEEKNSASVQDDDKEYGDQKPCSSSSLEKPLSERAVDLNTQFVAERLNYDLVIKLIFISLVTLPDEMPVTFQSAYVPINDEDILTQHKRVSRMIATQLTRCELGPGAEITKNEGNSRALRKEQSAATHSSYKMGARKRRYGGLTQRIGVSKRKSRAIFNLMTDTKKIEKGGVQNLIQLTFQRIIANEKKAFQGGAGVAQQLLLVRLATRFDFDERELLNGILINHIMKEQKIRTELAILWVTELFSQFYGQLFNELENIYCGVVFKVVQIFSVCLVSSTEDNRLSKSELYRRYDTILCKLLQTLFERGEHKETIFHRILLEAPLLTPQALSWLQAACLDSVYCAFGITTLRELILTRTQQRNDLMNILFDLSYSDKSDVRYQSIETVKELYQIDFTRDEVRKYLISSLNHCTEKNPHPKLCPHLPQDVQSEWDDTTIRSAMNLFLSIVPIDHSLVRLIPNVYIQSTTEVKKLILRSIETAIKATGGSSKELINLIKNCPAGAETLAVRIVHLLTERNLPTPEIVECMLALYDEGRTDIRSLIPILNGLYKEQVIGLLPTYILNPTNQKTVPIVFEKLTTVKNIKTGKQTMSACELLVALHRIPTSSAEASQLLLKNIDLLVSRIFESKEMLASAIDTIINDEEIPTVVFQTIVRTYKLYRNLSGFISNVLVKVARRKPWLNDEDAWSKFVFCLSETVPSSFIAILTILSTEEFIKLVKDLKKEEKDILPILRDYMPSLSANQQKKIDRRVREIIFGNEMISANKENVVEETENVVETN